MANKLKLFNKSLFLHRYIAKKYGMELSVIKPDKNKLSIDKMACDNIDNPITGGNYLLQTGCEYWVEYNRIRPLELVSEIIKKYNIQGNIAEAGVNLGNFAWQMNACFPDRKLYLYDTFEGFVDTEVELELKEKYASETTLKNVGYFKNETIIDKISVVKNKMKYPENCIFRKGYFPDTAEIDKDEIFAFVSLDMDLYKPMSAGLEFFYPQLSKGGYIFIHDYDQIDFFGIKKTLDEFETKFGLMPKVPLPDRCGTLVLTK